MKFNLRGLVLLISVLALVLLGGAGGSTASVPPPCSAPSPSGRLVCVTVEDTDGVSPSGVVGSGARQVDVEAYQFYKLTVINNGGSTLTNGSISVVLTDRFPGGVTANSTALYISTPDAPSCAVVSTNPNRVDCTLANIPANSQAPMITLAYRTSTSPGVASTDANVTTSFKEGSNGPNGANPATFSFVENTSLEPDPEASVAWSPPGQNVQLGTSPTFDTQFTTLQYKVPTGKSAFTATMSESSGTLCAAGLKQCFGEVVTTDLSKAAPGTFNATNLFHLVMTMDYALLPSGNTKSVVVVHQPDTGPIEKISQRCSSSPPGPSEPLPCTTVDVTGQGQSKLLVVGVWGFQNGGWVPGL